MTRLTTAEFTAFATAQQPPDEADRVAWEAVRAPTSRLQLDVASPRTGRGAPGVAHPRRGRAAARPER